MVWVEAVLLLYIDLGALFDDFLIWIGFECICGELILDLCNARTLCSEPKHFLWQIEKS